MPINEVLRLTGSGTIADAPNQREKLVASLQATQGEMIIDLSGIEQADVTLVQLLAAAQATAARKHRRFTVSAWSAAASSAFESAGFPTSMLSAPSSQG